MKTIPQRELRNQSGEILRQAEAGEQFTITVDSRPVAVLGPFLRRQWIPKEELLTALRGLPPDTSLLDDLREMDEGADELTDPWAR